MKHITGAEARALIKAATPGPWHASDDCSVCAGRELVANAYREPDARLIAAAPDLAESLAAVEAERDALRAERDAYREYYRARQALITADDADSTSVLFAAEDRVSAARERIAALREAAK